MEDRDATTFKFVLNTRNEQCSKRLSLQGAQNLNAFVPNRLCSGKEL